MSKRSTKVDASEAVKEYIDKSDWRINANANTNYSHAGLINNLAGKMIANYWLDEVYSKEEGEAHRIGDYHIHDLDNLSAYCCGSDFQKLLDEGFNGVSGRVGSKPPKHFREALYQLANYFGILQAEWAGAQAVSSFDTYLAPYVFFDMYYSGITEDDIKKAIRNFVYNLNVPSRWGQPPFTNITIDWTVPQMMRLQGPTRGGDNYFLSIKKEWEEAGKLDQEKWDNLCSESLSRIGVDDEAKKIWKDLCEKGERNADEVFYNLSYAVFQKEMNIINRCFYEVLNEGDMLGIPFTFPIPTINITEDFDWEGENVDLLFESTAKYGYSYFQNFIGSQYMKDENGNKVRNPNAYSPNDVRSMCCRLQLDKKQLRKRGGGLFGSDSKTGCYDEQTEVLTKNGWKFFKDLTDDDEFYTLTENREIELHKANRRFIYDFDGEMIKFKSRTTDLLVTPNHNMVLTHNGNKTLRFKKAEECNHNFIMPLSGNWNNGISPEFYTIKAAECAIHGPKHYTNINVPYKAWLKFLGMFISEGGIRGSKGGRAANEYDYEIVITQKKKHVISFIDDFMKELPFNIKRREIIDKEFDNEPIIHWSIRDKALWYELKDLGCSWEKYIPSYIFDLSKEYLEIFYESMMLGDGWKRKSGSKNEMYMTSSIRLANDWQHLCMLLGKASYLKEDTRKRKKPCMIRGREIQRKRSQYEISCHFSYNRAISKSAFSKEYYKGKVYCIEVPNHIIYVRRNGKTVWCGNSIGVVTINLPRLGYLYKGNEKALYKALDRLCDMAKSTLEKKRKVVTELLDRGLYPYTRRYIGSFDTFFSTIGVNGANEMIRNFTNDKHDITDEYGQDFAKRVLKHIREKLVIYQEETGNLYNLEATPAEGTMRRFAHLDKKKYPDILQAGTDEMPFYNNSTQLPVDFTDDAFSALDLQDDLQCLYTGGTTMHLYMRERVSSADACKRLVRSVLSNYRLPYISITPTFSICPKHGRLEGEHEYCPLCDVDIINRHSSEVDTNL